MERETNDVIRRPEFTELRRNVDDLRTELENFQMKWRLFFGTDEFRRQRAIKGAAARWKGHKAKRPKRARSVNPLAGFDPFAE